jgi:hypothetical protein
MNRRHNSTLLTLALASFSVAITTGCTHEVQPVRYPEPPPIVHCFAPQEPDSFAKTGEVLANGTRWAWNEAQHAWMVVSSEDTKKRVTDAYHNARQYLSNALKE